jgi:putative multiple sugar transport system permease protein
MMKADKFEESSSRAGDKIFGLNISEWGMYIALLVTIIFFAIATNGIFVSPRNIDDLIKQTGYTAVLAIGMTLVIIIQKIDLSVGYLSGFLGAVAATAMVSWHWSAYTSILLVLVLGILAGLLTAFLIAKLDVPAFVATLGGWLGYRGALQLVTRSRGTIIIPNDTFNAIGNAYIPDIPGIRIFPGVHKLTLILGILSILFFILNEIRNRKKNQVYNIKTMSIHLFIIRLILLSLLIGGVTWVFASYRGLSWTAVIVLIVFLVYDFIMSRTTLGRHIYAVGGNPQAAELSGISVKKIIYVVFGSMGMLAALAGILFASRFKSATTTAGTLLEMDAITAAFIGGTSPYGGVGKVTGSIIGAFLMTSLTNGMNLMGVDISFQYIVRAIVLVVAVIFDIATHKREK